MTTTGMDGPIMRQLPSGDSMFNDYNIQGQLTRIQTPEGDHDFTYDAVTGHLSQATSRDGLLTTLFLRRQPLDNPVPEWRPVRQRGL